MISYGVVSQFYRMNPETEDLIPGSEFLANGMVVLLEDSQKRATHSAAHIEWGRDQLMMLNRWCTVSNLVWNDFNSSYEFVATYEDGFKCKRYAHKSDAWLVKLDSMNKTMSRSVELHAKILELVNQAMLKQNSATYYEDPTIANGVAEETTRQIMELL